MWWVLGIAFGLAVLAIAAAWRPIAVSLSSELSAAALVALAVGVGLALRADATAVQSPCDHAPALYEIYFDPDSSTPRWESVVALTDALQLLRAATFVRAEVRGHADGRGTDEVNTRVAQARADAVALWLTGHGVAGHRLSVSAVGNTRPVAGNDTGADRAKNRRVDIAPVCERRT